MIWVWLGNLMVLVMRLILPPPKGMRPQWIDRNGPCPACGNRDGCLEFERISLDRISSLTLGEPRVKHTCNICKFKWYEKPVSVPDEPAI